MLSIARYSKRFRILPGLVVVCLLAGMASAASPEPDKNASTEQNGEDGGDGLKNDFKIKSIKPATAGINEQVTLAVTNFEDWLQTKKIDKLNLVLFINEKPLKGVPPQFSSKAGTVVFPLKRGEGSEALWSELFRMPFGDGVENGMRHVKLGVGLAKGSVQDGTLLLADDTIPFHLIVLSRHLWWLVLGIGSLLIALIVVARSSNAIRESTTTSSSDDIMKPYSLAKLQMATWFLLVLVAYLFIGLVSGNWSAISAQALSLMGIATGTALGAALIEDNKNHAASEELRKLEPQAAAVASEVEALNIQRRVVDERAHRASPPDPVDIAARAELDATIAGRRSLINNLDAAIEDAKSRRSGAETKGFLTDVLSDANGYSFHRIQIFVWTAVLAGLFLKDVFTELQMPQFNETMLALMGLSAGTYLGFKLPERPSATAASVPALPTVPKP